MEKVICDVCGTDYPETAAQCPICGCARGDGGQTAAGNTAEGEERAAYTYTRGGHFSKSNVRKRLKAAQVQSVPVQEPEDDSDYDDYDEVDDEQDEPTSNRGLIAIVILLLLAIIAVSSYIVIVHLGGGGPEETKPITTTAPQQTKPTVTNPTVTEKKIPCTGLTVIDKAINLKTAYSVWQLGYAVEPRDTTDPITFVSSDDTVVTVDGVGRVTAIGNGEATITITCGSCVVECPVVCDFGGGQDKPTDPTNPTDPTVPVVPPVELKLNRTDFTLDKKGSSWNVYSGQLDPSQITWTSDNEQVVTVENGKVVAVGLGRTQIHAEYQGQKVSCYVSCRWTEKPVEPTQPTEPVEPTTPVEPTEPEESVDPTEPSVEPEKLYSLLVNGRVSPFGDEENAEVTIKIGETFSLTVEDEEGIRMDVTWAQSKEGIVAMDGRKITGAEAGKVILTAAYGDQTFTCTIIVKEQ